MNKKKSKINSFKKILIAIIIGIIITVIGGLILIHFQEIFIPSDIEKLEQYIDENVKGSIYIYENETNEDYLDVTMIVLNNGNNYYFDEVIFKLSFVSNYQQFIRNNENDVLWCYPVKPNISKDIMNYTEITWNEEYGCKPALNFKQYLYANFSVKIFSTNIEDIQVYDSYIIIDNHRYDYIKKISSDEIIIIREKPNIKMIGELGSRRWDIQTLWNQIVENTL